MVSVVPRCTKHEENVDTKGTVPEDQSQTQVTARHTLHNANMAVRGELRSITELHHTGEDPRRFNWRM